MTLLPILTAVSALAAASQTGTPPPLPVETEAAPPAVLVRQAPDEVRAEFRQVLTGQPSTVRDVLRLDPGLMQNEEFLSAYPGLQDYLATHPDIVRNPVYYVGEAPRTSSGSRYLVEAVMVMTLILSVTGVVIWLIRTLIDYRRWSRLTRVQTDVHSKLLDRFTNIEDLQAYFESPGGRRFLESAPIPLDGGGVAPGAPANRILWSVQAGFVLALAGAGLYVAIPRVSDPDMADALNVFGTIAVAVGIGFVISAGAALLLSSKMGLIGSSARTPAGGGR
jgi:hypothetical protein